VGGGGDNLVELRQDGAVEPGEDMEFHADPVSDVGEGGITPHVVDKGVLAEDEEEEAAPLGEGWRCKVEDDGNEVADVEDVESLSMERSDGIGVGTIATQVPTRRVDSWDFVVLDLAVVGCAGGLKALASHGEGLLMAGDVGSKAATLGSGSGCGVYAGLECSGCLSRSTLGDVGSLLLESAVLGDTKVISRASGVGGATSDDVGVAGSFGGHGWKRDAEGGLGEERSLL
jgi:hypothetical protein